MKALVTPNVDSLPESSTRISTRSFPRGSSTNKSKHPITPQEHDASIALASMSNADSTSNEHQYVSFPVIIHKVVTETTESDPAIIQWVASGKAFKINEKHKKLGPILKEYFNHGKYSSVQRQLNMYGWSKHLTGSYKGAFYHPNFHRESTFEQLRNIKRKGPPSRSTKASKVIVRRSPRRSSNSRVTRTAIEAKKGDGEWKAGSQHHTLSSKARKRLGFSKSFQTKAAGQAQQNISLLAKKQLRRMSVTKSKANSSSLSPSIRHSEQLQTKSKCKISNHPGNRAELSENRTPPSFKTRSVPLSTTPLTMEQLHASPGDWSPFLTGFFRQESIQIVNSTSSAQNENPLRLEQAEPINIRSSSNVKPTVGYGNNVETPMIVDKTKLVQSSIDHALHFQPVAQNSTATLKGLYKNIIKDRPNAVTTKQVESAPSRIHQTLQNLSDPNQIIAQALMDRVGTNVDTEKTKDIVNAAYTSNGSAFPLGRPETPCSEVRLTELLHLKNESSNKHNFPDQTPKQAETDILCPNPKSQDITGQTNINIYPFRDEIEMGMECDANAKSSGMELLNGISFASKQYSDNLSSLDETDKELLKCLQSGAIKDYQADTGSLSDKSLLQHINSHKDLNLRGKNSHYQSGDICFIRSCGKVRGDKSLMITVLPNQRQLQNSDSHLPPSIQVSSKYKSPTRLNLMPASYSPKPIPPNVLKSVSIPKGKPPEPPALPLSRETSSSFAPLPLTRRVSSSFYLPFVGMSDTLSDALACSGTHKKQKTNKS